MTNTHTVYDLDPVLLEYAIVVPLMVAVTLRAFVYLLRNVRAAGEGRPSQPAFNFAAMTIVWLLAAYALLPPLTHVSGAVVLCKVYIVAINLSGLVAQWLAPAYLLLTLVAALLRPKARTATPPPS